MAPSSPPFQQQASIHEDDGPLGPTSGVRVLGISGSPSNANTYRLVRAALLGASEIPNTETAFVSLAGKHILPCNGCEACLEAGGCVLEDDMSAIYPELRAADAMIVGTSVYFGAPSALCKAFLERIEGFGVHSKVMRLKIGGAIAVAAGRNGGQETAMIAINMWFHINDMLPVGVTTPAPSWGIAGRAVEGGEIESDRIPSTMTEHSLKATEAAWLYGRKIATVAAIVKAGVQGTGYDLPDRPYGLGVPDSYPAALDQLDHES